MVRTTTNVCQRRRQDAICVQCSLPLSIDMKIANMMQQRQIWGIPSEKIGQNIHPLESRFFVINYQHWTSTSAFWPILAPLDHWGGLGGLGGDLGGPADPKNDIIARGPF